MPSRRREPPYHSDNNYCTEGDRKAAAITMKTEYVYYLQGAHGDTTPTNDCDSGADSDLTDKIRNNTNIHVGDWSFTYFDDRGMYSWRTVILSYFGGGIYHEGEERDHPQDDVLGDVPDTSDTVNSPTYVYRAYCLCRSV
jgi:hypothetical protein